MNAYTLEEYDAAGCPFLADRATIFCGLHKIVNGRVCDTGCGWFDGGKCAAYRKLTVPTKTAVQEPQETVRETAKRLGVTIAEIRRRRRTQT